MSCDPSKTCPLCDQRGLPILPLRYAVARCDEGVKDKAACIRMLCAKLGVGPGDVLHMGDDLPDLPALALAGLAVAPANAHSWVAERVHWQTRAAGGNGAVREACDLLLEARGLRDAVLAKFGVA